MQRSQENSFGSNSAKNETMLKSAQNSSATIAMPNHQNPPPVHVKIQKQTNGSNKPLMTNVLNKEPTVIKFELSLSEEQELRDTVLKATQPGKGFLAADDTNDAMGKRLNGVGLENTPENRRRYRQLLFTTPNLHKHISAVILYDDTFRQATDNGQRFVDLLRRQNIQVAIQVDMGIVPLVPPPTTSPNEPQFNRELVTRGLDDLAERIAEYKKNGCSIAKWYSGYRMYDDSKTPSQLVIEHNAMLLARYAMICQRNGIVPIVETDVICEGNHSLEKCQEVTGRVLFHVFRALTTHNVLLEGIILKTNMVTSGLSAPKKSTPEEVAIATLGTLQRYVPSSVPMVGFLSGGLEAVTASEYLNAINQLASSQPFKPWQLTFCYGRALQAGVLELWKGFSENVGAAQKTFLHRCRANSDAEKGVYESEECVANALASIVLPSNGANIRYY